MMQSGTILPFVMIALFAGYYLYAMRRRKGLVKEHSDKSVAAVARRLGMAIQEGDPHLNLYVFQQPFGDFRRRAVLQGQPYGRPSRLLLVDGQDTQERLFSRVRTVSFGCFLEVSCPRQFPPFEVAQRTPSQYLVAPFLLDDVAGLREISTGDAALDRSLRVLSTDPRVGQVIAPALRALVAQPYVHLAGHAGTLTVSVTRYGLPYFAMAPETYLLVLETAACALEGRALPAGAPVAMDCAPSPSGAPVAASGCPGAEANEGIPMPCSQCGAPMQLLSGPYLHSELTLVCGYCQQREPLPAQAAERVRHLQLRLLQLRQARENDEAPLRIVAMVRRSWVSGLPIFAALTAYQIYQQASVFRYMRSYSQESATALAPSMSIGAAVFMGYLFGYIGMSRAYRRAVKPLLRARPPKGAGLSARCRSCGGDLPSVSAPEAACRYCGATNLLDDELTRRASELLQAELAAYHSRSNRVLHHEAFRSPMNAFYRWAAAGAAAGIGISAAGIAILMAILGSTPPPGNAPVPMIPAAPAGRARP